MAERADVAGAEITPEMIEALEGHAVVNGKLMRLCQLWVHGGSAAHPGAYLGPYCEEDGLFRVVPCEEHGSIGPETGASHRQACSVNKET